MESRPKEPKHVACSRCRDRKVKCDGAKPSCRRCQRNDKTCLYVSAKKTQTQLDLNQRLGSFSVLPALPSSSPPVQPVMSSQQHYPDAYSSPSTSSSNGSVAAPLQSPTFQCGLTPGDCVNTSSLAYSTVHLGHPATAVPSLIPGSSAFQYLDYSQSSQPPFPTVNAQSSWVSPTSTYAAYTSPGVNMYSPSLGRSATPTSQVSDPSFVDDHIDGYAFSVIGNAQQYYQYSTDIQGYGYGPAG